jgi:hypothetical protein
VTCKFGPTSTRGMSRLVALRLTSHDLHQDPRSPTKSRMINLGRVELGQGVAGVFCKPINQARDCRVRSHLTLGTGRTHYLAHLKDAPVPARI